LAGNVVGAVPGLCRTLAAELRRHSADIRTAHHGAGITRRAALVRQDENAGRVANPEPGRGTASRLPEAPRRGRTRWSGHLERDAGPVTRPSVGGSAAAGPGTALKTRAGAAGRKACDRE
jgi:hypothetical protein